MKFLFSPMSAIVVLIIFFSVFDHGGSNCVDDLWTIPLDDIDSSRESASTFKTWSAPEEEYVIETKSVKYTCLKPMMPKAEPTPVITEETESNAEAKSGSETSPFEESLVAAAMRNKSIPVALPVISPEEAIKANEEAIGFLIEKEEARRNKLLAFVEIIKQLKPAAVSVLTPEEAAMVNKEAIRFQRNRAFVGSIWAFIQKIGLNTNRLHFMLSLLPLLLIFDVLLFKKQKDKKKNKVMEYFSLPRRICVLLSVSLLAFGLLVFVPWSVYFGNSVQIPFIFQDFVNWNLRVLTLSIISASIVLLLIPPIISDYLVAAIAGLGLCVYIQAMFMNQYLGTMNGVEPEWNEHRIFGTINMIIWIAIVFTPVVLRIFAPSYFSKALSATAGIILSLEMIATVSMVASGSKIIWSRSDTYYADGSNQFQLHEEKNVVVFVFDTLGSGFIKLCFEEYPETKDIVKDFIWYADARSNYQWTFPGLPNELTGSLLPAPANSFYDLFENMWHSPSAKSFYKQMSDAGYDARLYCAANKCVYGKSDCYHEYFSNIEARDITYEIDYDRIHFCLKQMSGFSFAPYFLKKYFFYAFDFTDGIVQMQVSNISPIKKRIPYSNQSFLEKMTSSGIIPNADKPVLAFYYTAGVHRPWHLDEKCNQLETTFDTPVPTTRSCFYVLSEFIRLLKDNNIYDKTAILVCSDHGGNDKVFSTPHDMSFMIKPFYENKPELTIDDSKVQSIDILPTLLNMACGDSADYKDFDGFSSFNIPKDRVRKVYRFDHTHLDGFPEPDPEFASIYPGTNSIDEYTFIDAESFQVGSKSKSFVRHIPLMKASPEDK